MQRTRWHIKKHTEHFKACLIMGRKIKVTNPQVWHFLKYSLRSKLRTEHHPRVWEKMSCQNKSYNAVITKMCLNTFLDILSHGTLILFTFSLVLTSDVTIFLLSFLIIISLFTSSIFPIPPLKPFFIQWKSLQGLQFIQCYMHMQRLYKPFLQFNLNCFKIWNSFWKTRSYTLCSVAQTIQVLQILFMFSIIQREDMH